jgi:hypothetical protein
MHDAPDLLFTLVILYQHDQQLSDIYTIDPHLLRVPVDFNAGRIHYQNSGVTRL